MKNAKLENWHIRQDSKDRFICLSVLPKISAAKAKNSAGIAVELQWLAQFTCLCGGDSTSCLYVQQQQGVQIVQAQFP